MRLYFESTAELLNRSRPNRPAGMLRHLILSVAILSVLALPNISMAQGPPQPTPTIDVELGPQGDWTGTVVDAQGIAVDRLSVQLSNARGPVAQTGTDGQGRFAFSRLPTGVHLLQGSGKPRLYRFWKHGTAPPKAVHNSLIIAQGTVVRGVQGSQIYDWMSDHWVLTYTGIAAAIVVPVVVIGSNQDNSPASP
jgi:hypothetical protein